MNAGQSPTFSPPGYATSSLRSANQLHFLPKANAIYRMSPELTSVGKVNENWLARRHPLTGRKTNFRLTIYSHSSTKPANLAKIDPVDIEITGLKGIANK